MAEQAPDGKRERLEALAPPLRRFARALCGRDRADGGETLVEAALTRLATQSHRSESSAKAAVYAAFIQANRRAQPGAHDTGASRPARGMAAAIARLALDQREVLLLVVLAGFTYDETATVLTMPRAGVAARLARARAALAAADGEEAPPRAPHLRLVK